MRTLTLTLALLLGTPALAASAGGADGHHYYTADDDGDGTANWADPDSDLYVISGVGYHAINLALLLGVLYFVSRKPVRDALRNRALGIRKEITDSARARDEARQRHEEVEARIAALSQEVENLRAEARREAEVEQQQLVARAHEEARRIAETAQRNVRDEVVRAQQELRREAVGLAVQLAEATLAQNIAPDDQARLARQFLDSLNREGANA